MRLHDQALEQEEHDEDGEGLARVATVAVATRAVAVTVASPVGSPVQSRVVSQTLSQTVSQRVSGESGKGRKLQKRRSEVQISQGKGKGKGVVERGRARSRSRSRGRSVERRSGNRTGWVRRVRERVGFVLVRVRV